MTRFFARDDLLSPAKAAELTGLSVTQIRRLLDRHLIPYETLTVGRRPTRMIRRSVLQRLLEAHELA